MSARPDPASGSWPADEDESVGSASPVTGVAGAADEEAPVGRRSGGDGAGVGPLEVEEGTILTDVASLAAERDEYLAALQRMKADFDNYRKRVVRLQEEQSARAAADLVTKVMPVLDNLDLAWVHLGDSESEEARALSQARAQLLNVLSREGLERIDAVGVPFDPTVHDAVAHATPAAPAGEQPGTEPADATDDVAGSPKEAEEGATRSVAASHGVVVEEVLRAGYRWRGQVLRPAMVKVRG